MALAFGRDLAREITTKVDAEGSCLVYLGDIFGARDVAEALRALGLVASLAPSSHVRTPPQCRRPPFALRPQTLPSTLALSPAPSPSA